MNMKKLVALLLALVMVFALCACGPKDNQDTGKKDDGKKTAMKADDIPDEMTSSDGKYQVAFVTDVGDLKDKSFNQGTYDGVKLYANANSKSYKYYKPANGDKATDDDRYDAMKAAVDNGAEVVVAAGFLQAGGQALQREHPAQPCQQHHGAHRTASLNLFSLPLFHPAPSFFCAVPRWFFSIISHPCCNLPESRRECTSVPLAPALKTV